VYGVCVSGAWQVDVGLIWRCVMTGGRSRFVVLALGLFAKVGENVSGA